MTQIATNPGADIRPVARTSRVRLWIALAAAAVVSPFLRPFFLGTPLAGEWWVGHGGHAELVNYHQTRSTQRDALDIMQVVDGSIHRPGRTDLTSYYIYDQPVLDRKSVV